MTKFYAGAINDSFHSMKVARQAERSLTSYGNVRSDDDKSLAALRYF